MGLGLADAGVGSQRGGDRQVAGELGQQAGVERRVVGHVAEADPRVEHRRPDRGIGVGGVGVVDDAEVAAHDRHVEGLAVVGTGDVGHRVGVADHVGGGLVEQERAGGAEPLALDDVDASSVVNVRPLDTLVELEV